MRTNLLTLAVLAGAGMLLASSPAATAALETYDFTFTSSGMDATGTITVDDSGGVAQSGAITVTGVPIEHPVMGDPTSLTVTGALLPLSGGPVTTLSNPNGDNVTFDNVVNFNNNPILTGNGLGFGYMPNPQGPYNPLIGLNGGDLYGNYAGPNVYTLFVGEGGTHANGANDNEYVYASNTGLLTLTAVPEPATYGLLAGAGLVALSLRRRVGRKNA